MSTNQYTVQYNEEEKIVLSCNRERIHHLLYELLSNVIQPTSDEVKIGLHVLKKADYVVIKCIEQEDHNGTIQFYSKQESGTKAVITFPIGQTVTDPIVRQIDKFEHLTKREKEVLVILGRGKSNKEIAKALEISEHTVKNHVANIFSKLGIYDRSQAIALLYQSIYKA